MKLGTLNAHISLCNHGVIKYNFGDGVKAAETDEIKFALKQIYNFFRKTNVSEEQKIAYYNAQIRSCGLDEKYCVDSSVEVQLVSDDDRENVKLGIQKLMDFFTEFAFEPNFRFVNTFAYACQTSTKHAFEFVRNYFELTDSQFLFSIFEKMKSPEFKEIIELVSTAPPTHRVNNRFKLYYGSAGTGKTTIAMREADNNCMVCHSAMLPSDLMEDFKFVDGKADFQPSALQNAITEGESIVLDEINLLPFESLRFLQSILDGKKEFMYKGNLIKIADGFEIIGTMNLTVNGCTYSLPEPLVDRCKDIRKYTLTSEDLLGAIL